MVEQFPAFQLVCGACRRKIGLAADVWVIDEEWVRRYEAPTLGRIICRRCSLLQSSCLVDGEFVDGHLPVTLPHRVDHDLWDHHVRSGTQRAMVFLFPEHGAAQGARAYLRAIADRPGTAPEVRERLMASIRATARRARVASRRPQPPESTSAAL